MPDTPEAALALNRSFATDEERQVLALEAIADQMRLLVSALMPIDHSEDSPTAEGHGLDSTGAWENEGGSLAAATLDALGIKHTIIDQYEVGGYRYTKLDDAIGQAKRSRYHHAC